MITPSFSLTATEKVMPKLALDFTTASLDPRITFTRTTDATHPATYINSSGVLTASTNNAPRFDYDPTTLACKGLLIEESKTNALKYSEDFSNPAWITGEGSCSVTTNTAVAPDGNTTADTLVFSAAAYKYQAVTGLTVGAAYRFSVWLKVPSGTATIKVQGVDGGVTVTVANLTTSWKRFEVGGLASATTRYATLLAIGAVTVQAWGAQWETGSSATSYIPTTTAALTRNADVAAITGTSFSSFWQATRGGVLVRALPSTVSGTRPLVQFDDNTANNIIALRGSTTNPELYIRSGGVDQATIDAGTISAAAYRLAGTWAAGNAAASLNSGTAVLGAPGAIPAATQARLGSDGTNYLNGHLQALEYYDSRISNTGLRMVASTAGSRSMLQPIINRII